MIEASQFASTFVGQYLIPTLVFVSGTLLLGGMAAINKIVRQLNAATVALDALDVKFTTRFNSQDKVLDGVDKQLKTNGGSTVKDAALAAAKASEANGAAIREVDKKLTDHLIYAAGKTAEIEADIQHLEPA